MEAFERTAGPYSAAAAVAQTITSAETTVLVYVPALMMGNHRAK
eukprot:COSAG05_NODE_1587_length_4482_cov_1520.858544_1_plen_44_part_00